MLLCQMISWALFTLLQLFLKVDSILRKQTGYSEWVTFSTLKNLLPGTMVLLSIWVECLLSSISLPALPVRKGLKFI